MMSAASFIHISVDPIKIAMVATRINAIVRRRFIITKSIQVVWNTTWAW